MIALFLLSPPAPIDVLELVEESPYVVVQAYIKSPPKMTEREAAAWQVLGRVFLEGTIEYTPQVLRDYGSQAGLPPTVTVMPDYMRLQVMLPKDGLSLAGDLVYSILTRPALREEDVAVASALLQTQESPPWFAAMTGIDYRYDRLRPGDVRNLWTRVMRPENLNFVVGGGIVSGDGRKELESRFERWNPVRDPGPPRADGPPAPRLSHAGPVSTFLLSAKTLTPASSGSAAKLLSVFALGVGKESSMVRLLREDSGLSYFQGAVLWPTQSGWVPSFAMVRKTQNDEARHATEMRDALLKDIDAWTDATVTRARAMAEASFERNLSVSPIWLGPDGPRGATLIDRCAWRGYLEMVGSGALREEVLVRAFANVDLDQLKAAGKALLDECNVGWLPGRP